MSIDVVLYLVASLFFLLAAAPISKGGWQFEWLGFAVLVLTLIV